MICLEQQFKVVKLLMVPAFLCSLIVIQVNLVHAQEVPIHISRGGDYTYISPETLVIGETATLHLKVDNKVQRDISCIVNVVADNTEIFPGNEQNITVTGAYYSLGFHIEGTTEITFKLTPKIIGVLAVKIELWYEGRQVDFVAMSMNVVSTRPPPYIFPWEYVLAAALVSILGFVLYRRVRAYASNQKELRAHYDREILNIAKNYGGVVTKSVVVYELELPLENAGKWLERFVRHGEAQRIGVAKFPLYDFPSARTHLSRVDNQIIETLRDNIRGMTRNDLLKLTSLTIEPLDESLKRLAEKGILIYDSMTGEYKLRGIVLGKIKCPSCGTLTDVSLATCQHCGATL